MVEETAFPMVPVVRPRLRSFTPTGLSIDSSGSLVTSVCWVVASVAVSPDAVSVVVAAATAAWIREDKRFEIRLIRAILLLLLLALVVVVTL